MLSAQHVATRKAEIVEAMAKLTAEMSKLSARIHQMKGAIELIELFEKDIAAEVENKRLAALNPDPGDD